MVAGWRDSKRKEKAVQSEVGQGMADSDARAASAGGGHSGPFVCGGEMWGSDPSWPPWHLHLDRPSSPIHRPCAPGSCRLLDGEAPRQVRWPFGSRGNSQIGFSLLSGVCQHGHLCFAISMAIKHMERAASLISGLRSLLSLDGSCRPSLFRV